MPEQSRRQNRSFDRAGQENKGIEHEFFVRLLAAGPVLRITPELRNHISDDALALQKLTCCVVLRLRDRKYLETKKRRSGVDLTFDTEPAASLKSNVKSENSTGNSYLLVVPWF
jgi:hypothetical protein